MGKITSRLPFTGYITPDGNVLQKLDSLKKQELTLSKAHVYLETDIDEIFTATRFLVSRAS